ncbi:glycosyltransferase family 39 protein [Pseudomonas folii]|uniref:Glycosyltransferase family 39 protein n=1 Tax=Pseudomonas folii TaxID=2762593 RepID=A0ABR7AYI5_9PSED|nr:glycosyltransferase family 39 protein [Pseudomonas folii]MBC3949964.1 glycosyltransferase family 39 protein [Pseudomonas folii]
MQPASRLALLGTIIQTYQILPIVVLAAAVRSYGIINSSIWFDEAYSVLVSETTPSLIWFHSAQDVHPPLYYFLLHFWMRFFGDSVFSVRVMSALIGTLTVPISVWLVGMIASRRAAILAGFLSALLPIAVRYSQEARMYALLALCCVAATLALVYWVKNPTHHRYLFVYTLLMAAGFYTHYFAGPCLFAHWVYLLFIHDNGQLFVRKQAWWMSNLAIAVLYLPWIPSLIAQLGHTNAIGWIPQVSFSSVISMIWEFLALESGPSRPFMAYVGAPLIATVTTVTLLKSDLRDHRFNLLMVLYTFTPILLMALVSLKLPLFWTRYFVFSAMGLPLLIALVLDKLMERYFRLGIVCLITLVMVEACGLYSVYTGVHRLNNPYQSEEAGTDKVMNYLNEHWASGDRVLVYGRYLYLGATYYNRTPTTLLLYTPGQALEGRPDKRGPGSLWSQDADALYIDSYALIPVDTQRVWLVYETNRHKLDVPAHWRSISHVAFGDTQLWLYSLEPVSPR